MIMKKHNLLRSLIFQNSLDTKSIPMEKPNISTQAADNNNTTS
ncbi:hypothetical protein RV15_GL003496 [Enterococcus silesiacus]|uniref:Uncharacterized protein n=1 Tax=Enterococcus silesiacus TaxID=332949 RepID=A0AA91GKX8_9ENTE|nr:hypothetical protein RV15_GL003496 [Enterococcus silesiacus]